jgi:hypothetical protein
MEASPAATQAPEPFLVRSIDRLDRIATRRFGIQLFRAHENSPRIVERCHRFRATNEAGLLALAKDVSRVTVDCIDKKAIHRIHEPADASLGSLKTLESFLGQEATIELASRAMGPLYGLYELRIADAHPAGADLSGSYEKLGIDPSQPWVLRGQQLLHCVVTALWRVGTLLQGE